MKNIARMQRKPLLGLFSATMIIVAAMIGTGIFTITGYIVNSIKDPISIIMAWSVMGVISLCGALSYAEIASVFSDNGGEYLYLTRLIHPSVGFMSGWVSFIAGFSAPCAAAATAFSVYSGTVTGIQSPVLISIGIVTVFSIIHIIGIRFGGYVQNILTIFKVILIIVYLFFGLKTLGFVSAVDIDLSGRGMIFDGNIWSSMLIISYAYAGWNMVVYISGEVRDPEKNIPFALVISTAAVTIVYVLINMFYVRVLTIKEMGDVLEIGFVAMKKIYGENIGKYFSAGISIALASFISALIMAGPRIYEKIGSDYRAFSAFSFKTKNDTPVVAIVLQYVITVFLIITMNYESLIYYIGFTLNIFSALAVGSVFVIRKRKIMATYRVPLFPVVPIIFIIFNVLMILYTFISKPKESIVGLVTVLVGYIIYNIAVRISGDEAVNDFVG